MRHWTSRRAREERKKQVNGSKGDDGKKEDKGDDGKRRMREMMEKKRSKEVDGKRRRREKMEKRRRGAEQLP